MAAPAYRIIEPTPARVPEIIEFHTVQLQEQLAVAHVNPAQVERHTAGMRSPEYMAIYQQSFEERLADPNFYCRLVEQEAAVQGLIMARGAGTNGGINKSGVNELWNLEVAEHLRGQGVASELMTGFMTGPAEATRFTQLTVLFANIRARNYYTNRWDFHPFAYDATMTIGSTSVRALTMTRWPEEKLKEK
jgi:ribosomal protein S18 acetylase RimI-like enzyme